MLAIFGGLSRSSDAGLLVSEGTDKRQNNLLAVVGFEHQVEPDDNAGQKESQVQDDGDERTEKRNQIEGERNDGHHDPHREPGDVEKDGLESVEADEPVLVIGGEDKEQNPGDEAQQITQRTGHVVGHCDAGGDRRVRGR
jgi:hypothetical protein